MNELKIKEQERKYIFFQKKKNWNQLSFTKKYTKGYKFQE